MTFSENLSKALAKHIKETNSTQLKLANESNLSHRFVGDIIRGDSVPTLRTFEQICAALEVTPNDLLLREEYNIIESKPVTKIFWNRKMGDLGYFPICPNCNITLEREYQAYCDRCGAKLSWKQYDKAEIISSNE
ncbi:MAG: helix-turn-helix transcriptional regulator [Clostridia bacterium]|nr:helix-turn-helix transcriptional regulator [Clostridia bacterium]